MRNGIAQCLRSGTTLRQDASPGRSSTSESTRPCRPGSSLIFSRCSPIFQGPWRSDCQHQAGLPEPLHEYQLFLLFLPVLIVALIVTAIAIGAPWMLWGYSGSSFSADFGRAAQARGGTPPPLLKP